MAGTSPAMTELWGFALGWWFQWLQITAKMKASSIVRPPDGYGLSIDRSHLANSTVERSPYARPLERRANFSHLLALARAEPMPTFQARQSNLAGAYEPTHKPHSWSYGQSKGKSPLHIKAALICVDVLRPALWAIKFVVVAHYSTPHFRSEPRSAARQGVDLAAAWRSRVRGPAVAAVQARIDFAAIGGG